MRRSRQDALDTRARIIDAASRVFFAQGLTGASLEDIAHEAGVSRGAVYGHFKNKEAVFQAVFDHADLPLDPFMVATCDETSGGDPLAHLHRQLRERLHDALHRKSARRFYSIAQMKCEATEQMSGFHERLTLAAMRAEAAIAGVLASAQRCGQLPVWLDTTQAAGCIHALLSGFYRKRLLLPDVSRVDDEVELLLDAVLRVAGHGMPASLALSHDTMALTR